VSPRLTWTQTPAGTKSFALICDDPDAPSRRNPASQPWVHWVIYNISATATELSEHVSRVPAPPEVPGAQQGINSWPSDNLGYLGPMPPTGSGPHRYYFRLYALDTVLTIAHNPVTKTDLLAALQGHILAQAELMGTYERR